MTDVKWVNSRISFDLAAAIKAADGKLHIDDALIIAGTPCVLVDYATTPVGQLKYISRAMRHFFKKNPRYTHFTKSAVALGLRRDWLPTLEDEDKRFMLTDFILTPGVDNDGFIICREDLVKKYTESEHPDHERYGHKEYTHINHNGFMTCIRKTPAAEKFYTIVDNEGYISTPLNITADEWYQIIQDASPLIKEFLGAYILIPDLIASPKEVEEMFGLIPNCINARNIALGRRAQRMLSIEVYDTVDKESRCYWSTAMQKGRSENGLFRWIMRPELIEAAKILSKEENWDLPRKKEL